MYKLSLTMAVFLLLGFRSYTQCGSTNLLTGYAQTAFSDKYGTSGPTNTSNEAWKAFDTDGNGPTTFWQATSLDSYQFLMASLTQATDVCSIEITWGANEYPTNIGVTASNNYSTWTTLVSNMANSGSSTTINIPAGLGAFSLIQITFSGHAAGYSVYKLYNCKMIARSANNQPPSVSVTGPATGSSYQAGGTVSLAATATDADGQIANVKYFYDGTNEIISLTSSPYSYSWVLPAAGLTGTHSITAKATDNGGAVTTSAPVSITINAASSSGGWSLGGNTVAALQTFGTLDNFALPLVTNSIERMRVTPTGNLLLGTTTDNGYKLNVNGSTYFNNGAGAIFNMNATQGIIDMSASNAQLRIGNEDITSFINGTGTFDISKSASLYFRVANGGNIGIGTSAPAYLLDVNGNGRFKNTLTIGVPDVVPATPDYSSAHLPSVQALRLGTTDVAISSINKPLISFGRHNGSGIMLYDNFNTTNDCSGFGIVPYALESYIPGGYDAYFTWNKGGYQSTLGTNELMRLKNNGNLILGSTTDNGSKLQVTGSISASGFKLATTDAAAGKVLTSDASGNASWQIAPGGSGGTGGNSSWTLTGANLASNNAGYVSIGTGSAYTVQSSEVKLAVYGAIYATKLKVTAGGWADYVFAPSYKLRSLKEVEKFIKQNQHLPEIPSAAEVEKNGVDLGENQTVLLKKVEELTLYMIALNKKVEAQNALIKVQASKIQQLTRKHGFPKK